MYWVIILVHALLCLVAVGDHPRWLVMLSSVDNGSSCPSSRFQNNSHDFTWCGMYILVYTHEGIHQKTTVTYCHVALIVTHCPSWYHATSYHYKNIILQALNCLLTEFVFLFVIGRSEPLPTIFPLLLSVSFTIVNMNHHKPSLQHNIPLYCWFVPRFIDNHYWSLSS